MTVGAAALAVVDVAGVGVANYEFVALPAPHEAEAALPMMKAAGPRAEVALQPPVLQPAPVAGRHHTAGRLDKRGRFNHQPVIRIPNPRVMQATARHDTGGPAGITSGHAQGDAWSACWIDSGGIPWHAGSRFRREPFSYSRCCLRPSLSGPRAPRPRQATRSPSWRRRSSRCRVAPAA